MKTLAKDVILLCKGWCSILKYDNVLEALKQYYRINYCDGMEDQLNESFLLRVILTEVMREIAKDYPDRLLGFVNGYMTYSDRLLIPDERNNDYDYQLFWRIVNFLARLQMRGDGLIDIDTKEYFEEYMDGAGKRRIKLKEAII